MRTRRYLAAVAVIFLAGLLAERASADVGVPLPAIMPVVIHESCPAPEGTSCTWPGGPIYLDPEWGDRFTYWHELGHAFDYQEMDDGDRAAFMRLIRHPGPWRSPPDSAHEQFAEAYALCALRVRPRWGRIRGGAGYEPRPAVHHRVCTLIRGAQ